jgi:hypothetical protein
MSKIRLRFSELHAKSKERYYLTDVKVNNNNNNNNNNTMNITGMG